ncbi:hypothetical protein HPG69_008033 [Diceros bicornis minor]|uniref:non-specific serine/threonine protein kinase n=1 Tax=Diceros bicornis minor TaxID=77932 RepID=A0A7J7F3Q9_DICBM|nr:hypothetical protein HPG69_008033 [Diceros bicornis minor]
MRPPLLERRPISTIRSSLRPLVKAASARINELFRDVHTLKALNRPNIVKLSEVIHTKETLFPIIELVSEGDCHQKGIINWDLKLENLLNVNVAYFGFSNVFIVRQLSTYCGSACYTALEILQRRDYNGPLYTYGAWKSSFTLLRSLPFSEEDFSAVQWRVLRGRYPLYIVKDPWVNMGQEKVRPCRELRCDNRDPWVTEEMMNMGFEWGKIQHLLRRRDFDELMAVSETPGGVHHCKVRPPTCPQHPAFSPNPGGAARGLCAHWKRQSAPVLPTWFRKADERPEEHQDPLPSLKSRTATPSPAPSVALGPSPPPTAPATVVEPQGKPVPPRRGCNSGDFADTGQPDGVTSVSPSGPSQGQWGCHWESLKVLGMLLFLSAKNQQEPAWQTQWSEATLISGRDKSDCEKVKPHPCIVIGEHDVELRGAWQCGVGVWPEAGRIQLRVGAGQAVQAVCTRMSRREDLVQWMTEMCKLLRRSLHRIQVTMVSGTCMAFKSIVSKILAELRGRPGGARGT